MNFYDLPQTLAADIKKYDELVKGYKDKTVDKVKFKAFRVPMGVYEQRESETYMCRVRLPGGAITPTQLIAVAAVAKKYSDRPLHFTTRQEVQIHHLKLENTVKIMQELKLVGLSTRGGGPNTIRNIMGAVSAGVDQAEAFDISPYVQALTSRMIAEKDSWSLPRKLKIAFSGSPQDEGLATVNDLGFVAKLDPKLGKGFAVYIAGGMGSKPQPGILLYPFVPEKEVYNIARAVKVLFDKYGNRKNKNAARMRFLFNNLGKEELEKVKKEGAKPLSILSIPKVKTGFLEIPLFLGDLSPEKAKLLGNSLKEYGEDIVRAATTQNLLLRNIDPSKITELKAGLQEQGILEKLHPVVAKAAACAGASTCRLGICLSRGLLEAIKDQFEKDKLKSEKLEDIALKVSGCPNSCGHHPIADIGFYGVVKRQHNRLVPSYTLVVGAVVEEGKTKLAEKIGVLPAKNIPFFLSEFLKYVQQTRKKEESFAQYLNRVGRDEIDKLLEKYSLVPDFHKDKNYYYDWSATEIFSLAGKAQGECSAGIYDLIDWDFSNIKDGLTKKNARSVVLAASRALLVTKGLEPKSEREAVELFRDNFIGRHLEIKYKTVIDKYLSQKDILLQEAQGLSEAVRQLYDTMDNSLKFPELENVKVEQKAGQFRDFRGVACPMNFVKTKLVLETMQPGEKLEILLDDGEPIDNVPGSVKAEGHKILKQEKKDNYWMVVIKKV